MILQFRDLKDDQTKKVACSYSPKELDVEFFDYIFQGTIDLSGEVERSAESIRFSGFLNFTVDQVCGRCLRVETNQSQKNFDLYYEISEDDVVDATEDIRELIMIEHPMVYTCTADLENCIIPAKAGEQLSESDDEKKNSPFSNLKGIIESSKKEKKDGAS